MGTGTDNQLEANTPGERVARAEPEHRTLDRLKLTYRTGGAFALMDELDLGADQLLGAQLGNYRLDSVIGEGGMGLVFCATRVKGDFSHQVAVKFLTRCWEPRHVERFCQEQEILAQLSHPGIARLYDGDVFRGSPYIVMELIDGQAVTEWCTGRPLRDRIQKFAEICGVVGFAHRNGIIHRDLKPSNIMVDRLDQVKLLDFGIATGGGQPDEGGFRAFTPRYASPEQAAGRRVTAASDVYQLGQVLFEILMQTAPGEGDELRLQGLDLPRQADLQCILDRMVHEAPELRYPCAEECAAEFRRFLAGHPVAAMPPTMLYRVRRFYGRHRLATLAVLVVVMAGIAGSTYLGSRLGKSDELARRQQESLKAQAQQQDELSHLVASIIELSKPGEALGSTAQAIDLLQSALDRIRGSRLLSPRSRVEAYVALGDALWNHGEYALAADVLAEARPYTGSDRLLNALIDLNLARLTYVSGERARAGELYRSAADAFATAGGQEENHLKALGGLALVAPTAQARIDRSTDVAQATRQFYGDESSEYALALTRLSIPLSAVDPTEAVRVTSVAEGIARKVHDQPTPALSFILRYAAAARYATGQFEAARDLSVESLSIMQQAVTAENPDAIWPALQAARLHAHLGEVDAARELVPYILNLKANAQFQAGSDPELAVQYQLATIHFLLGDVAACRRSAMPVKEQDWHPGSSWAPRLMAIDLACSRTLESNSSEQVGADTIHGELAAAIRSLHRGDAAGAAALLVGLEGRIPLSEPALEDRRLFFFAASLLLTGNPEAATATVLENRRRWAEFNEMHPRAQMAAADTRWIIEHPAAGSASESELAELMTKLWQTVADRQMAPG